MKVFFNLLFVLEIVVTLSQTLSAKAAQNAVDNFAFKATQRNILMFCKSGWILLILKKIKITGYDEIY